MAYLRTGEAHYPVRIGHEWCGVVVQAGDTAAASLVGQRVTGDTMLGCGQCRRCLGGRQHLCAARYEIGIRGGWPGALAEQLLVPASAVYPLPADVGAAAGALVEPGGNALRAVRAALAGGGQRLLVMGPGTIGLLAAQIARSQGAEVHLLGAQGLDGFTTTSFTSPGACCVQSGQGALADHIALELSQRCKEMKHEFTTWSGGIHVFGQALEASAFSVDNIDEMNKFLY